MKTLYDEEGNPIEVPEEEEVKSKVAAEYEAKIKEAETKLKEMEDDPVNKNFKLMREQKKRLEDEVASRDKKLAELGHAPQQQVTDMEQVRAEIRRETRNEIVGGIVKRALSQFDDTERPVVEHYFKKLTNGEEVDEGNVDGFIADAARLATPKGSADPIKRAIGASGRVPRTEKTRYSETADGKALASKLGIE